MEPVPGGEDLHAPALTAVPAGANLGSSPKIGEVHREAAMDVALKTPVAEGDPPEAGEPSGQVPGGPGG